MPRVLDAQAQYAQRESSSFLSEYVMLAFTVLAKIAFVYLL